MVSKKASASAIELTSKDLYFAVGILLAAINFFEKALLPSKIAPSFLGPITVIEDHVGSLEK